MFYLCLSFGFEFDIKSIIFDIKSTILSIRLCDFLRSLADSSKQRKSWILRDSILTIKIAAVAKTKSASNGSNGVSVAFMPVNRLSSISAVVKSIIILNTPFYVKFL